MTHEHDKLVRDRIPELIRADGAEPVTHTVEDAAYADRLAAKLREEAAEWAAERGPDELADVLEVLHAIRTHEGLSTDELAARRERKARRRGRFEAGTVLEAVREPDTPDTPDTTAGGTGGTEGGREGDRDRRGTGDGGEPDATEGDHDRGRDRGRSRDGDGESSDTEDVGEGPDLGLDGERDVDDS